jgi:hypothetical protein
MKSVWNLGLATAGLAGALAIGACGGDSGGPKSATTIDQSQAAVVGEAAAGQIGALANGLITFNSPPVGGLDGGFLAPQSVSGRFLAATIGGRSPAIRRALALLARADTCNPTVSNSTDTDGDGIEDNNTITFSASNCTFLDTLTGVQFSVAGSVHIQDTDDANTFYGYAIGFSGFGVTLTDTSGQSPDLGYSLNGSFGSDVGTGSATATQNLRSSFRVGATTVFADAAVWTVGYAPTSGTIDPLATQLPAGGIDVNGSYAFSGDAGSGNSESWSFGVRTNTSLQYDGSCTDDLSPFTSGTMDVYIVANQTVGFNVAYGGCGAPVDITAYTS